MCTCVTLFLLSISAYGRWIHEVSADHVVSVVFVSPAQQEGMRMEVIVSSTVEEKGQDRPGAFVGEGEEVEDPEEARESLSGELE